MVQLNDDRWTRKGNFNHLRISDDSCINWENMQACIQIYVFFVILSCHYHYERYEEDDDGTDADVDGGDGWNQRNFEENKNTIISQEILQRYSLIYSVLLMTIDQICFIHSLSRGRRRKERRFVWNWKWHVWRWDQLLNSPLVMAVSCQIISVDFRLMGHPYESDRFETVRFLAGKHCYCKVHDDYW
jgi:hypothetical protein